MKKIFAVLLVLSCMLPSCFPTDVQTGGETQKGNENAGVSNGCFHIDEDDNGKCDKCTVSVIETVDFYAINDLHGKLDDTSSNEGVDELTTFLKNCAETDDHTVILSSGDMWQGSSESNLTNGHIITEWMNEIDTVSMTLGNHEFDWGSEYITSNAEIAEFPFLAINIYDRATNKPVSYCSPSVTVQRGNVTIGIIGAIGDCYSSISGDKVEDVYFKTGDELTALVKTESDKLRANGADIIVYSLHDGYGRSQSGVTSVSGNEIASYYDISLSRDGYVDLVFEGHTHRSYVLKDSYGVYHLQSGGDNDGIAHVEMQVNFANLNSETDTAEFIPTDRYDSLSDDPRIDALLEKYKDKIAVGASSIGTNRYKRSGDEMRNLVAKLYYERGMQVWGSRYDIVLGGGFISIRSPGYLEKGDVTYSMIQTLFPFDNALMLCKIKGSDLRDKFIYSNNSNYFVYYEDGFEQELDPNETYYIVVDTYSSTYGPNRLTEVEMYNPNIFARDIVADYIAAGGLA